MEIKDAINLIDHTNYTNFRESLMALFRFQSIKNKVYNKYLHTLQVVPESINRIEQVPFLPISFFKTHRIITDQDSSEITFYSSSTSGKGPSKHEVRSVSLYEHSFKKAWNHFYPDPSSTCFLCLLPSYLEREGSSLIYMAEHLVDQSRDPDSGFFLYDQELLHQVLLKKIKAGTPTVLLGVSFALLDFAEAYQLPTNELIVMETGGMKGRRKELIREELHDILCKSFGVREIHSEYGMTELLSQAYSKKNGVFQAPPWMRVFVRDQDDPFGPFKTQSRGRLYIADLANAFSCSFIETDDLGLVHEDGSFEVMGRLDHSDMRGCNTMI